MRVNTLFPTPIFFFDLEPAIEPHEIDFIKSLPQRANMGNTTSQDNYLNKRPEMARLNDFFKQSVAQYMHNVYAPKYEVDLRITQCWANYTEPGQYHHKHEHPNSLVSGVFYVQSDPALDRIYFYRTGYQTIKITTENFNTFNSESWWFESVPNTLILFPSSLSHNVDQVKAQDTRISISFNTFPVGQCGVGDELTELIL